MDGMGDDFRATADHGGINVWQRRWLGHVMASHWGWLFADMETATDTCMKQAGLTRIEGEAAD